MIIWDNYNILLFKNELILKPESKIVSLFIEK